MLKSFVDSNGEYTLWLDGIRRTHLRDVTIRILDLDHTRLGTLDDVRLLDANVTIDVTRTPTRVLEVQILDRTRSIGWEPDTIAATPIHLHRMLQVLDRRWVAGLGWVNTPVFTGPVADVDRDGAILTVTCDGKDKLAMCELGAAMNWPKKTKVTRVIRDILVHIGEHPSRIHLPELRSTLPDKLSLSRMDKPWEVVRRLARSVDRVIFYDGRGHVVMKRAATAASLTVDKRSLCSAAKIDRQMPDLKNRWIVLGAKPRGAKARVSADVWLPSRHPYSPSKLGRNGKPRWLIEQIENTDIKTKAKARDIAERRRDEQQLLAHEVSFECLPFPHVEEWDLVRVIDPATGRRNVRVRQVTLPLMTGPMQVGAIRRTGVRVPKPRRKKRRKKGGRRG